MVLILAILLSIQLFFIYYSEKRNFLSIAFFSTAFFLLSDIFYIIGIHLFQKDLLPKTVIFIYASLVLLTLGEWFGLKLKLPELHFQRNRVYKVKNTYIYLITIIMIIIFIFRFYDLYLYSLKIGNTKGIRNTISATRLDYAMGNYKTQLPLYFIFTVGTLISEIIAYCFIYIFMNNLIVYKKYNLKLLFPVAGYIIILIALTERISYIKLFLFFIVSYILVLYKRSESLRKKVNKKIVRRVIWFGGLFAIFFFSYGAITRGIGLDTPISETLSAYIGAPLYGLNIILEYPLPTYDIFGYYTLSGIYRIFNLFGANINISNTHLPMFEYGHQLTSNIYTSLALPAIDYGQIMTVLSRFPLGLLGGIFQKKAIQSSMEKPGDFVIFIITCLWFYCALMAFCADGYKEIFLSPSTIIKYTAFAWVVIKYIIRYRIIEICDNVGDSYEK